MPRQTVTRRRSDSSLAEREPAETAEQAEPDKGTRRARNQTRSSRVAEQAKASAGVGGGWGNYGKAREAAKKTTFNTENQFKVEDDEPILIKFLQDTPFDTYYQHWVQRGKGKKRSWTCPGEDDCPLCFIKHPVRFLALFNVVEIDGAKHTGKYWTVGPQAGDQIEEFANSKRHSPINADDLYFEVIRKEADYGYKYTLNPLRATDLEDEEVVSPTEEASFLGSLYESDRTTIEPVDYEGLEEVAAEVVAKGDS